MPSPSDRGSFAGEAIRVLAETTWLFAPLVFAGGIAAIVLRFDLLAFARRPLDCGAAVGGVRLFGDNKTWRGLLVAVVAAAAGAWLQARFAPPALAALSLRDDAALPAWAVGALMGLGAILGELPNSFLKRRLGIAPGATARGSLAIVFYVADQVDLLFGVWPLIACCVRAGLWHVVASFALAMSIHPTMSLLGRLLGARRTAR